MKSQFIIHDITIFLTQIPIFHKGFIPQWIKWIKPTPTEKSQEYNMTGWWFGTWLDYFGLCFHILRIITPTDFHIFQRG